MLPVAEDVLDFWFAEDAASCWFGGDAAFDAQIRERFGEVADAAAAGRLDDWASTPSGWLALLIALDQFSRNLHRNGPRAWAQDARALPLALAGIERGDDQRLLPLQRVFAYLPLEHAEDLACQDRSVALFESLCEQVPADERDRYAGFLDYARKHREVIARFGRFPHRNTALGRESTPAEQDYLATPGAGF